MDTPAPDNESVNNSASIPEDEKKGKKSLSDSALFKAINWSMPCVGVGLYISGVTGVTNPKILHSRDITHVLNLAHELQDITFPDFVNVRHVGLRDAEDQDLLQWLPELVEYIHSVISSGGNIVVNCVAGVSRSASVCIAYKISYEDLSLRAAFDEVHKARSVVSPNPVFWQALIRWEEQVRGENSVVMMPYICGMVPELESYDDFTRMRLRVGWMEELIIMWSFHLLMFCLQVIGILRG